MKTTSLSRLFCAAMSLVILCSCGDDKPEPNVIVRPKDPKAVMAANLGEYLSKDYPSNVSYVEVTSDQVIVKGSCSGSETTFSPRSPLGRT